MPSTPRSLASFVAAVEGGTPPDDALRAVGIRLDSGQTVVPGPYLEPLCGRGRLRRWPAALLCDTAARACVDAQGLGTRRAVFAAHRMRERRAFQRLGYRSDADYAREQLGITARAFRDLARLGARLEGLPRIKNAFLAGDLTRTQAEVVAAVATPGNEEEWLERARSSTVRGLKAAAREARERAGDQSVDETGIGERSADDEGSADPPPPRPAIRADSLSAEDEPRHRRTFDVPAPMLGKIDAVLELAARVAGAPMPAGTLWEFIAAEYLSGAPLAAFPGDRDGGEADGSGGVERERLVGGTFGGVGGGGREGVEADEGNEVDESGDADARDGCGVPTRPCTLRARRPATPEDPRGYQRVLERESRNWYFLPTVRPRLELHGEWKRLRPVREEREEEREEKGTGCEPRTPWELHRELEEALAAENRVAWQLGRLLTIIRNRRLWRSMCFASFSHYVRERLGISPRAADRLVRIDRAMWDYPPLQRAYHAGDLSPLAADTLVRLLRHIEWNDEIRQAWIDFAASVTFEHLTAVVRGVERLRAMQPLGHRGRLGTPTQVEAALASDGAGSPMFVTVGGPEACDSPDPGSLAADGAPDSPMFVTGAAIGAPDSPMFVTSSYAVWMTEDEDATLAMAMETVRGVLGAEAGRVGSEIDELAAPGKGECGEPSTKPLEVSDAACLDALLDHFLAVYDDANAREMRRRHAVFERDGWRCRAPGCSAYGPLHAHHIVFRAHGGSDDPDNLVTLCDFHHKALHDRWICCAGRAPGALYWELGTDTGDGPREAPVDRVAGHRRLADDEYWVDFQVLSVTGDRGHAA